MNVNHVAVDVVQPYEVQSRIQSAMQTIQTG